MTSAVAAGRPRVAVRVRLAWTLGSFGTLALLACLLAPLVGSTPIHLTTVFDRSLPYADNIEAQIFWVARLPRVLAAALVGSSLALAGVVFQALLRNPLASPDTLGVSAGASLGAMIAITFNGTVKNCGNVALTGVTVTNQVNNSSFLIQGPINLAINEVASFTGTWVPLNPCSPSTATLVATGTDSGSVTPKIVTASASTTCSVVTTPGIQVTKTCPTAPVLPGPYDLDQGRAVSSSFRR
jgi:hypothetical protein